MSNDITLLDVLEAQAKLEERLNELTNKIDSMKTMASSINSTKELSIDKLQEDFKALELKLNIFTEALNNLPESFNNTLDLNTKKLLNSFKTTEKDFKTEINTLLTEIKRTANNARLLSDTKIITRHSPFIYVLTLLFFILSVVLGIGLYIYRDRLITANTEVYQSVKATLDASKILTKQNQQTFMKEYNKDIK